MGFFCYYLVESGEGGEGGGVWGGRFSWENKKKRMERHKDIVRKRRIVVGSQNHREREREMHISQCKKAFASLQLVSWGAQTPTSPRPYLLHYLLGKRKN
jgi:hypothetical protein